MDLTPYVCTYAHMSANACMHTHACVCVRVYVYVCVCVWLRAPIVHTCVCSHVHVYVIPRHRSIFILELRARACAHGGVLPKPVPDSSGPRAAGSHCPLGRRLQTPRVPHVRACTACLLGRIGEPAKCTAPLLATHNACAGPHNPLQAFIIPLDVPPYTGVTTYNLHMSEPIGRLM